MLFDLIVSDPPWHFKDKLKQSKVKRGAESQYKIMTDQDIIDLDVKSIASDDSVLVLWVPSSKLQIGMDCMKSWGFSQKQTFVWVKDKKEPLDTLIRAIKKDKSNILKIIDDFDINNILRIFMGRIFRQSHEIALIGTRGKVSKLLKDKSQSSVFIGPIGEHSEKPEALQDRLDKMYDGKKLEMFARRDRPNWTCAGYECPSTLKEDIRDSIKRLQKM